MSIALSQPQETSQETHRTENVFRYTYIVIQTFESKRMMNKVRIGGYQW